MTRRLDISVNELESGHIHVTVQSEADTRGEALSIVRDTYDTFIYDAKEVYRRTEPEVASDTDFDTKITRHKGYARFTFLPSEGTDFWASSNDD